MSTGSGLTAGSFTQSEVRLTRNSLEETTVQSGNPCPPRQRARCLWEVWNEEVVPREGPRLRDFDSPGHSVAATSSNLSSPPAQCPPSAGTKNLSGEPWLQELGPELLLSLLPTTHLLPSLSPLPFTSARKCPEAGSSKRWGFWSSDNMTQSST